MREPLRTELINRIQTSMNASIATFSHAYDVVTQWAAANVVDLLRSLQDGVHAAQPGFGLLSRPETLKAVSRAATAAQSSTVGKKTNEDGTTGRRPRSSKIIKGIIEKKNERRAARRSRVFKGTGGGTEAAMERVLAALNAEALSDFTERMKGFLNHRQKVRARKAGQPAAAAAPGSASVRGAVAASVPAPDPAPAPADGPSPARRKVRARAKSQVGRKLKQFFGGDEDEDYYDPFSGSPGFNYYSPPMSGDYDFDDYRFGYDDSIWDILFGDYDEEDYEYDYDSIPGLDEFGVIIDEEAFYEWLYGGSEDLDYFPWTITPPRCSTPTHPS
jgi:hypothetical protein